MNIHEHQAKQILKKYGAVVPEGVFALNVDELIQKQKHSKLRNMCSKHKSMLEAEEKLVV